MGFALQISAFGPKADISSSLSHLTRYPLATGVDLRMRKFFFCFVFFLGLAWVIDVFVFEGQNSADAWQQVQRIAQKFTRAINDQVGQVWR